MAQNTITSLKQTPSQYKKYTEIFIEWIKKHKSFTHKDISKITDCNCSYSVLRCVKQHCRLIEAWVKKPKRYKIYFYNGDIEKTATEA